MSDAVLIALITTGGGSVGAVLLFIRRLLPPRPASARDVAITEVWDEIAALRKQVNDLVDERDAYRTTARILSDSNDALTAAVSRANPPLVFTAGERQAIDRATARRAEDDNTWPTLGGRP